MEINNSKTSDAEIIQYMSESTDVDNWNRRRDAVKAVRDSAWIGEHIDASGLIVKAKIPNNVRVTKPWKTPRVVAQEDQVT